MSDKEMNTPLFESQARDSFRQTENNPDQIPNTSNMDGYSADNFIRRETNQDPHEQLDPHFCYSLRITSKETRDPAILPNELQDVAVLQAITQFSLSKVVAPYFRAFQLQVTKADTRKESFGMPFFCSSLFRSARSASITWFRTQLPNVRKQY